jgi:ribokinase
MYLALAKRLDSCVLAPESSNPLGGSVSSGVVVVGSANVDFVVQARRQPAPGETVLTDTYSVFAGGKGANQAVAAARAGAEVSFIGCVGADEWGQLLLDRLAADRIDVTGVAETTAAATGAAFITVTGDGENSIIVAAGANALVRAEHVLAHRKLIRGGSVLCTQLEVPIATARAALRVAREAGKTTVLTPAPVIAEAVDLLPEVDVLIANLIEGRALADMGDNAVPDVVVKELRRRGARAVLLTMGAAGALVADSDGHSATLGVLPSKQVVDTTGAGDTFAGFVAARLALGDSLIEAAMESTVAAGISVGRPGAQCSIPTWREVAATARD